MATISLKPKTDAPAAETAIVTTTASSESLAAPINMPSAFEGEYSAADIRPPYLSLCQKSGNLMDEHPEWLGQFIHDKAVALGTSINVIFFKISRYYLEDLPYGSDSIPQKFYKIADARAAGVETINAADLDMLVEVPADYDLAEEVDGKKYVAARYTVRKTSFAPLINILGKDLSFAKNNRASLLYALVSVKKTNGSNSWYAPTLRAQGFAPQAVQDYIAERF